MKAYMEYDADEDDLVLEANGEIIKEIRGFSKGTIQYPTFVIHPLNWVEYKLLRKHYPDAEIS